MDWIVGDRLTLWYDVAQIKKNTDFVDMVISNVLHDVPFSQNQLLNSADG